MTRRATLHNRQDSDRRRPPHELATSSKRRGVTGSLDFCNPCEGGKRGGIITQCEHCRSATKLFRFSFPDVRVLVSGSGTSSVQEYSVEWATDCVWEGDDIPINCGVGTDQFGWAIEITGKDPGEVSLTFRRRSGSNCDEMEFTYRSFFPLKCRRPILMFLDSETLVGVEEDDLPCSLCVQPTYENCLYPTFDTCECPENWSIEIEPNIIRTNSGPLSGFNAIDTNWCYWWTTSPGDDGLYTLVTGTTVINIAPHLRSVSLMVEQFSSIGEAVPGIFGSWNHPFWGLTALSRWLIEIDGSQLCPGGCWHGETLDRTTGPGPEEIVVEHLDG